MSCFCLQQSRTANGGYEPLQANPYKPLPKIYRLSDWFEQNTDINQPSLDDSSGQTESSDRTSSQQKPVPASCSHQKKTASDNSTQIEISKEEFKIFPRFGPSYGEDTEAIKTYKQVAWNKVCQRTGDEESTVYGDYLLAIKRIEDEAREAYDPSILGRMKKSDFQRMMIFDGCYFLQLAFYILGGAELLDYHRTHADFGKTGEREKISRWIKAMFFIGNQIPCVVIRELMKQRFFQDVIKKGIKKQTWDLPSDLPRIVLYLLVVAPELESNTPSSSWLFSKLKCQEKAPYFRENPSNLLHGLHCLDLRLGSNPLDWEAVDLEAGTKDLERRFPSATKVEHVGVTLEKTQQGIMEIKFRRNYFLFPTLYVPRFTFDGNTEFLLQHLKRYQENIPRKGKREVETYLRFMSDLIQTENDVNILKSKGIIKMARHVDEDELPAMLNKLGSSEEITLTENLRLTRSQIVNYSTTTRNLISLAAVAFFLGVVQTVFTILAYFYPRN